MGGGALTYILCRDLGLYPGSGSHYFVTLGKFFTLSVPVSHVQSKHGNAGTFRVMISKKIVYTKHSEQWLARGQHGTFGAPVWKMSFREASVPGLVPTYVAPSKWLRFRLTRASPLR